MRNHTEIRALKNNRVPELGCGLDKLQLQIMQKFYTKFSNRQMYAWQFVSGTTILRKITAQQKLKWSIFKKTKRSPTVTTNQLNTKNSKSWWTKNTPKIPERNISTNNHEGQVFRKCTSVNLWLERFNDSKSGIYIHCASANPKTTLDNFPS